MAACAAWPDGIQLLQLKAARPSGRCGACVTHLCRVLASQLMFSHARVCFSNTMWSGTTTLHSSFHLSPIPLPAFFLLPPPCRIVSAPFLPSWAFFPFPLACAHFPHHHIQAAMLLQVFASHCILGTGLFHAAETFRPARCLHL